MTVIFRKPDSYSLYDYDNVWYLTYPSGGSLESGASIKLNPEEISRVHDNLANLELLIKELKSDRSLCEERKISPVVTSKGPPEITQWRSVKIFTGIGEIEHWAFKALGQKRQKLLSHTAQSLIKYLEQRS